MLCLIIGSLIYRWSVCLLRPYVSVREFRDDGEVLLSHHTVVWGILSLLCVILFFVCHFLLVRLRISQRRKKLGAWNFACMLAYYPDRSFPILEVKGQRSRSPRTKTRSSARSGSADVAGRHGWTSRSWLNRRFVQLSSMVKTVGRHWELQAAAFH